MKILFGIIMLIWAFIGCLGLYNHNSDHTNWFMIIFMLFVPVIPLVAKFCGLL